MCRQDRHALASSQSERRCARGPAMAHRALVSAWRVAEACTSPRRYPGSRRPSHARVSARRRSASRATAETPCSGSVGETADAASLRAHYEREGWVVVRGVADAALVDKLHAATDALEAEAETFTRSRRHKGVFFETQSASGRKSDDAIRPGALRKIGAPSKRGGAFAALVRSGAHQGHRDASLFGRGRLERAGLERAGLESSRLGAGSHSALRGGSGEHEGAVLRGQRLRLAPRRVVLETARARRAGPKRRRERGRGDGRERRGKRRVRGAGQDARPRRAPKTLRDAYDGATEPVAALAVFDESFRRCPRLRPGDAVFFHPMLAHGSGRNVSARRRRIATLWYVAETSSEG